MTSTSRAVSQIAHWMCWMARGISTLAAAFWLLISLVILACDALVHCSNLCLPNGQSIYTGRGAYARREIWAGLVGVQENSAALDLEL